MRVEVVVTEALDRLAVDDGGEGHGELVQEERVDPDQLELDAVGRGDADASHLLRRARDVLCRALEAVEELGALGVDARLEQALERELDVGGGERPTRAEDDVVAEAEAEMPAVGARRPRLGEPGYDVRSLIVLDQRVEEHLLEGPGDDVVAARGVQVARVLRVGEAKDAARVWRLTAGRRARGRRVERDGAGCRQRTECQEPGEASHTYRRSTKSISPWPIRLKPTTASAIDTPGANTSQGATAM